MNLDGAIRPKVKNLSSVMTSALAAIGKGSLTGIASQAETAKREATFDFPAAKRACVVLADGLGYHQLSQRFGHAPNIRTFGNQNFITTVVPSTTAAGITSLGTGLMPGQTAVAGYSLKVPGTRDVFSLISWNSPRVNPETWQTQSTLFETVGGELVKVQPAKYVSSGLTQTGLRGGRTVVAENLTERVDATVRELRAEADLVYLYWDRIDATGHRYGWTSEQWIVELEHFDEEFGRLVRSLPSDTLVVLTADHGMIDVSERIDIRSFDELTRDVDVVAGESRAVQVYTSRPEDVANRWQEFFEDDAWILTKSQAVAEGLFGPVTDFASNVIGDVFAFAKGTLAIVDSKFQSPGAIGLIGVHGSLTQEEMHIPLFVDVL
ncbi:putative AlkP superfamily pyrophosphatase or phosphodiesterase [Trueperella bonasi]|uniref:AlkP superfamily pyrophosphatase or phosphodiesterase n=1 Tax=Trueperella bonasi TaxID=312286 RepID=A0ABT9NIA4_9ACTO|nr:alkaline phosphatase family protein [Trueperella bonasi]MDP9807125.1 putative AlkP superfamily pyrophosphatase or phosphodiesterase [Trueperella bonasi]